MQNQSYENHREVWRDPAVESTDIYPGLVVQDDRVGGSITIRSSRLPLWTLIGTAIREGWDEVQEGWDVTEYNYTAEELADFLYSLLEARGEFARLLLEIDNANRGEEINWWVSEKLNNRVRDQLTLCLESLARTG